MAELSALEAAYARAKAGHGQAVLLVGEAGAGTSHLVHAFVGAHTGAGTFVADLSGRQGRDSMPLALLARFADLVARRQESAAVTAVASDLATAATGRARAREIVRLVDELVDRLCELDTVIVVLDDARTASSLIVDAVAHVARRSRKRKVLTLIATRPDDERIDTVLAQTDALVIPVDSFDRSLAREFVEQLMADSDVAEPDEDAVTAIVDRAGGNPRYLIELTAAHVGATTGDSPGPVPTLGLLVHRRVERLGTQALDLVRAAAIAGGAPSPRLCALVCGLDPDDEAPLAELIGEGMIELDGHGLITFPNPTVHEIVLASTPHSVQRELHAATAGLLTMLGEDASVIAPHALAAAAPGDTLADEAVRMAAEAAGIALHAGNPRLALDLAERALRLVPGVGDEAALRTIEGEALLHLGHVEDAARAFERAITLESSQAALLGLARALQRAGELDAALDAFTRCKGLGAVRGKAEVLLGLGRVTAAREAAAAAVAQARREAEDTALASALSDQALVEAVANSPVAVKHAAASVRAWRRAGEDVLDWPPLFSLGVALETDDRFDESLGSLAELRTWLDSRGLLDQVPRCVRTEVVAAFLGCRWARMEEALAAAIDVRRGEPNHEMGPIWAASATLAAARGDERGWQRGQLRSREALAAQTTPFDAALSAWWRSIGHALRLEPRAALTAATEAVWGAAALGAANLEARAIPALAMLSGVLGAGPRFDILGTYRDVTADCARPSSAAGELLIGAFSHSGRTTRAAMVEAAGLYATSENRLGLVLTVACAAMTPGSARIPADLLGTARELVSSLGMRGALVASLLAGEPAADGHLA
ncbi:MAG: AAA family ATPase [Acidimicrobiia bacterium]